MAAEARVHAAEVDAELDSRRRDLRRHRARLRRVPTLIDRPPGPFRHCRQRCEHPLRRERQRPDVAADFSRRRLAGNLTTEAVCHRNELRQVQQAFGVHLCPHVFGQRPDSKHSSQDDRHLRTLSLLYAPHSHVCQCGGMPRHGKWWIAAAVFAVGCYVTLWLGYALHWSWLAAVDSALLDPLHRYGVKHPAWVSFWKLISIVFGPWGFRLAGAAVVVFAVTRRNLRAIIF